MNISSARTLFFLFFIFSIFSLQTQARFVLNDFDGDGTSDLVVFHPENGNLVWYLMQSTNGYAAITFGSRNATVSDGTNVLGDYDGDGKTDIAVVRRYVPADPYLYWFILNSSDNTVTYQQWGLRLNDGLVPQDYDGDGKTDLAIFRHGEWWILRSSDRKVQYEQFGASQDGEFVGGDYDGDGKADLAVVRDGPAQGGPGGYTPSTLYLRLSRDGTWASYSLGDARITGVLSGDYDGDGKSDVAIWQGSLWLWIRSSDDKLDGVRFGSPSSDTPIPGDYDGDGKTDPAVIRAEFPNYHFYILGTKNGFQDKEWGLFRSDGYPVSGNYIGPNGF